MLRRFALRASAGVVFPRRLPGQFNHRRVFVTPSSHLRYWTRSLGRAHADLLAIAAEVVRPGMRVWDVGANVGVFTFAAAALAGAKGSVLGVEADVRMVSLLRRSARLAGGGGEAPVEILPAAVTESVGVARFNLSAHGSASNSLEGFGRFAGVQAVDLVPTVSLDWLAGQFAPPDVIKIDVEGAEACVLRGGSEMLARHRPVVVCEVGAECRQEVSRLLRAAGYLLYNPKTPAAERVALDEPSGDILAVPVAQ